MEQRTNQYDEKLKRVSEAQSADITNGLRNVDSSKIIDPENEDPDFFEVFMRVIDDATLKHPDADNVDITSDPCGGMELAMTQAGKGKMMRARVKGRMHDNEGRPIGHAHSNPLLDSRKYEIEYIDGQVEELTANIIAENLIAQVYDKGRQQMKINEILDHRVLPDAISRSEGT